LSNHEKVEQPPLYELSPGDSSLPAGASHGGRFDPDYTISVQQGYETANRHQQRELREKVIALNVFLGSMNEFREVSEHGACLQDALRERSLLLLQLASLTAQKSRTSHSLLSSSGARRLFLLYAPSGAGTWALHWIFFSF
jgi:hypothetical protein